MRKIIAALSFMICLSSASFAEDKEGLSNFQLLDDRIGPVTIGLTPEEASNKLGMLVEPKMPPDSDEQNCYYVHPEGYTEDIGFMVEGGRITRIDIISDRIASINGIRIGEMDAVVRKAFPDIVKEQPHPYLGKDGTYLVVETKPGFGFIFETMQGKITSFRSGKMSSVLYIEGCL